MRSPGRDATLDAVHLPARADTPSTGTAVWLAPITRPARQPHQDSTIGDWDTSIPNSTPTPFNPSFPSVPSSRQEPVGRECRGTSAHCRIGRSPAHGAPIAYTRRALGPMRTRSRPKHTSRPTPAGLTARPRHPRPDSSTGTRARAPPRRRIQAPVLLPRDGPRPPRRIRLRGVGRRARPFDPGVMALEPGRRDLARAPPGSRLAGTLPPPLALRDGAARVPVHRRSHHGGTGARLLRAVLPEPVAHRHRAAAAGAPHRAPPRAGALDRPDGGGRARGPERRVPRTVSARTVVLTARHRRLYCGTHRFRPGAT